MSAYFHSYLCGRKAAEWLIDMNSAIEQMLKSYHVEKYLTTERTP